MCVHCDLCLCYLIAETRSPAALLVLPLSACPARLWPVPGDPRLKHGRPCVFFWHTLRKSCPVFTMTKDVDLIRHSGTLQGLCEKLAVQGADLPIVEALKEKRRWCLRSHVLFP